MNHPLVHAGLAPCARCGKAFCPNCLVSLGGQKLCGGCKGEQLMDVRSGALTLDIATPGARFVAQLVDQLVLLTGGVTLSAAFYFACRAGGMSFENALGVTFAAFLLLLVGGTFFYEALMLKASGQTLGKSVAKIKVVTREGGAVGNRHVWIRAAARLGCQMVSGLNLVDVVMVYSQERRTLHDRAAGTVVVRWEK